MFALLVIVVTVVALLCARHIVNWARFIILARKLPSPKTVPFIGNIEFMTASLSDIIKLTGQYFQECPRFYAIWLGPIPTLYLRDPRDVEVILGSGAKNVKRSMIYNFFRPLLGDGLGVQDGVKWEQHRKLLNPAFHTKILENYIQVFARKSEVLVQKLENEVGQKSFDVTSYFCRLTIDMIYESLFEKQSECLDKEEDNSFITGVKSGSKHVMRRVISPWLYPDVIFWNTSVGKECKKLVNDGINEVEQIINSKRQKRKLDNKSRQQTVEDDLLGEKKRPTFLELLLDASEYGVQVSDMDINDEVRNVLMAGFDTVRVALCWAMQILGNHPEIQEKIYEELENILQGSDRSHTAKDLNEMKYLERVIKEVLRMYPPLPFFSTATIRDIDMGGYTIPTGMMINIPIYHVHRNPEIYPDAEKFDPDRFLPQTVHRHPYAYIPFSAGPRNCIGQKFAMLQLKTVLSYIIRYYKIYATREKLTLFIEVLVLSQEGFHISIEKRIPKNATE